MPRLPDPKDLILRVSALDGVGAVYPDDLVKDLCTWVSGAVARIQAGEEAPVAFGLKPKAGKRGLARRVRQAQRDTGIAAAFAAADGPDLRRGELVLQWWSWYESGRPVPPGVADALDQVRESGLQMPTDAGTVVRASARVTASRAVTRGSGSRKLTSTVSSICEGRKPRDADLQT